MKIITLLIQIPIVILAITVHEFSHAIAAYKLGDDTAKRMGRLTLNPIKHLDIIGALMLLFVRIGWAKPVPINPYNFDNPKRDIALTAGAGPLSNFIMAMIGATIFRIVLQLYGETSFISLKIAMSILNGNFQILGVQGMTSSMVISGFFLFALMFIVLINIALGLFNLIPFPPLDGSKIIGYFMPDNLYYRWASYERKGGMILMIIFAASFILRIPIIGIIINPPLLFFTSLLLGV